MHPLISSLGPNPTDDDDGIDPVKLPLLTVKLHHTPKKFIYKEHLEKKKAQKFQQTKI